jgi:AcrR family transcriptional regulator
MHAGFSMVNLRVQQGNETRAQLIARARDTFATDGFAGTRFDAVGAELGLTSGVMYHHFRNKRQLFEEVVRQCHAEIAANVAQDADAENEILAGILRGCVSFIEEVVSPKYIRIVLVDSISVLGWETWKDIDAEFSEREVAAALVEAQAGGLIGGSAPVETLARLISGGTNELALWVYHQRDRKAALKQARRSLKFVIDRLRNEPEPLTGSAKAKRRKP